PRRRWVAPRDCHGSSASACPHRFHSTSAHHLPWPYLEFVPEAAFFATEGPMAILNETLDFAHAPADVRRAFLGQMARKRLLPTGHELYKFTNPPLVNFDGSVTPWWSSVAPLNASDPGLSGSLDRAKRLGVAPAEFARAQTAVTLQWNRMSGLLRARLLVGVF